MAICDAAHRQLDPIANGPIQTGPLPVWTRVHGKAAWWVVRGPLDALDTAWRAFHSKVGELRPGRPDGPPGDLFVCRPEDHATESQRNLLTILYVPLG